MNRGRVLIKRKQPLYIFSVFVIFVPDYAQDTALRAFW